MSSKMSIYAGDTGDVYLVKPEDVQDDVLIGDDWLCKSTLLSATGEQVYVPRTEDNKTDDGLHWVLVLSPSDTENLDIQGKFSEFIWVIEVSNETLSPVYRREKHIPVNIKKQGLPL